MKNKMKLEQMKNDNAYAVYNENELEEMLENYDALITYLELEEDQYLYAYRYFIETNQVKPAFITRNLLIPYRKKIKKMKEYKALINLLAR